MEKVWQAVKEINPNAKICITATAISSISSELKPGYSMIQPECLDIDAIYKRYGSRLTFDGGMGTHRPCPGARP